jgi:hypothetical protein
MRKIPTWFLLGASLGLYVWLRWYDDPVRKRLAVTNAALAAGLPPPPPADASAAAIQQYYALLAQHGIAVD